MIGGASMGGVSAFDWSGRRAFDPRARVVYGVLAVQGSFLLAVAASGEFAIDPVLIRACFAESALVVLFAAAIRWLRFERIAAMIEIAGILIMAGTLTTINSLVLASLDLPLADPTLRAIDRTLFGFDRVVLAQWLSGQPDFLQVSNWVYHSTAMSMLLMFAGLLWRCGTAAAWRALTALQIASIASLCVYAFVPAFGTPPYAYQFEEVLTGLRDGSIHTITASNLTGVITFPSMHAAGGLLLAWGFARVGRLAVPLLALNILTIVSAITSGGHYLIDVVAGLMIAAVAIALSDRVERNTAHVSGPPQPDHSRSVPSDA